MKYIFRESGKNRNLKEEKLGMKTENEERIQGWLERGNSLVICKTYKIREEVKGKFAQWNLQSSSNWHLPDILLLQYCIITPIIPNDYCWKLLHYNPAHVKDDSSITTLLCYDCYMNTVVDFGENLNFYFISHFFWPSYQRQLWMTYKQSSSMPLFPSSANALICYNCLICYKLECNCN